MMYVVLDVMFADVPMFLCFLASSIMTSESRSMPLQTTGKL